MQTNTHLSAPARGVASLVDLFAWPLRVSHYVGLINPLWATHTLQARVEAVRDETSDARTLTLRPGRGWRRHRAGQHLRLGVVIAGMRHTRTFSISSAPEDASGCIEITVKAVADGRVSGHLVRAVQPGDYLALAPAQGNFVLPDATPVRPLFVTAGSGITPVLSMLRSLELRGAMPDVVHVHYAPHARDVIGAAELERFARAHPSYRLHLVYTRHPDGERGADSHFSSEQLGRLCPDWRQRDGYAVGPQGLLAALEDHWRVAGLAPRLHVERFHAPITQPPSNVAGGLVRFGRSGVEAISDGRGNLLRLAEEAGLNPPHGCRMGICHSCTAKVVAGCVRDLRNNNLIDEPGTSVQLCVCAAAGDLELDL